MDKDHKNMLKLNCEEEKELYSDWNGSYYGSSEDTAQENQQLECLVLLEERVHQYPVLIDKWQTRLLSSNAILDDANRKMKQFIGGIGGIIVAIFILMLVVTLMKLDSVAVMLASGVILLLGIVIIFLLYFALKWTCFYGIHSEWEVFQRYIQRYDIVTLKVEIDALIKGMRDMEAECKRAEEYKIRLKKGGRLSEEEYQWASTRLEIPEWPVHTENLAKDLGKRMNRDK